MTYKSITSVIRSILTEETIHEDHEYWAGLYAKYKDAVSRKDTASAKRHGEKLFSAHGQSMLKKHNIIENISETNEEAPAEIVNLHPESEDKNDKQEAPTAAEIVAHKYLRRPLHRKMQIQNKIIDNA